ncbi:MAG: MFS transporter [candidate division WOR-3 bacterium]
MSPYLIQVLANAGLTGAVVYVPLLAREFGASTAQIGLIVGGYQGMLFLSNTLFGRWAEFADRKRFVVGGLVASALAVFAHVWVRGVPGLVAARIVAGLCAGAFPAALTAYFYHHDDRLGRFSAFGAMGWAAGALFAGAVSAGRIFAVSALALGAAGVVAAAGLRSQRIPLVQPFLDMRVLRRNLKLYLSFLLRHLGAFSIWTIFPVYMADLGASRLWVGVLWALNPLGQFVFMNLFERFSERSLIRSGLLISVAVFIAFAFAVDYRQLIPIQIVLALSWSCLYLGSLKQLMRRNTERSTAAGMLGSTLSLAAVLGALLESVTGTFGYRTVMLVAAGFATAGLGVFVLSPETESA